MDDARQAIELAVDAGQVSIHVQWRLRGLRARGGCLMKHARHYRRGRGPDKPRPCHFLRNGGACRKIRSKSE
ncbi:MAG: hypothetical protein ACLVJB_02795 [Christensenellales bacterium]